MYLKLLSIPGTGFQIGEKVTKSLMLTPRLRLLVQKTPIYQYSSSLKKGVAS
jgi:hypothetical protein